MAIIAILSTLGIYVLWKNDMFWIILQNSPNILFYILLIKKTII
jgi:hypothetical protein